MADHQPLVTQNLNEALEAMGMTVNALYRARIALEDMCIEKGNSTFELYHTRRMVLMRIQAIIDDYREDIREIKTRI